MSRLLVFGMAPLPHERSRWHAAPGLRTWQLTRPLVRGGHRVHLVTFGEKPDEACETSGLSGLDALQATPRRTENQPAGRTREGLSPR